MSELQNILEEALTKRNFIINTNDDHILIFQIIFEVKVKNKDNFSLTTKNYVQLDFSEINKDDKLFGYLI